MFVCVGGTGLGEGATVAVSTTRTSLLVTVMITTRSVGEIGGEMDVGVGLGG
jgi:hypothetical protein